WLLLRVGAGGGECFVGDLPPLQHPVVAADGHGGVQRRRIRLGQAAAAVEGRRDQGLVGPSGVDPALQLEVVAPGGDEAQRGVGGEVAVHPPGAERQQGVGGGGVVLQRRGLLARGLQLGVPVGEDPLLVGGGADSDDPPAERVGVL